MCGCCGASHCAAGFGAGVEGVDDDAVAAAAAAHSAPTYNTYIYICIFIHMHTYKGKRRLVLRLHTIHTEGRGKVPMRCCCCRSCS